MSVDLRLADDEIGAALGALRSGWLTMGPRIQALEDAFAARLGAEHAVAVSSGAAGLQLACAAAGVEPGASVVLSAFAAVETVYAVRAAGGTPLAADVGDGPDPAMTVEAMLAAADEHTVAVVATHLAGVPADADALRRACDARGVVLVEDATAALGATLPGGRAAGCAGHLAVFDLSPGHLAGTGQCGIVITGDEAHARRIRHLRSHAMTTVTWDRHRGHAESYDVLDLGFNFRMDEPRAALAASRLRGVDAALERRRAGASAVRRAAGLPEPPAGAAPQAVALPLRDRRMRDDVAARLARKGVPAGSWPCAWPAAAEPPRAADMRARTVLIDLGAAETTDLGADELADAVEEAMSHV